MTAGHPPGHPDRRKFLQQLPAAIACTTCIGPMLALAGCASGGASASGAAKGSSAALRATATSDGALQIPRQALGTSASVLVPWPESELPIHLYRESKAGEPERWLAVWARCTHRGCPVEPSADRLVCNCHGSEFTFSGEVLEGPARIALQRFEITTTKDHLMLRKIPAPTS